MPELGILVCKIVRGCSLWFVIAHVQLLHDQNVSPFGGYKSTSVHSGVIRRRLRCEFEHDLLCARVGPHVRIAYRGVFAHRWGESAGAISVALQMLTNGGDTEGLFRGAFMLSGSPIPVGDITDGQHDYDTLVAETGCSGAADTLQCLREVPFDTLKAAVDKSPGLFSPQVCLAPRCVS